MYNFIFSLIPRISRGYTKKKNKKEKFYDLYESKPKPVKVC